MELPYHVRYKDSPRGDTEYNECAGKDCDGKIEEKSGFLGWDGTTFECQSCGTQWHPSESNRTLTAGIVTDSISSGDQSNSQIMYNAVAGGYTDV